MWIGMTGDSTQTPFFKMLCAQHVLLGLLAALAFGAYPLEKRTSNLYTFGENTNGQIGDGIATYSRVPAVANISPINGKIIYVSAGFHRTFAITDRSGIWGWGKNENGQLGCGARSSSSLPIELDTKNILVGDAITSISANGYHTLAVGTSGVIYSWGLNNAYQCGFPTTNNILIATPIPFRNVTFNAVATGLYHSVGLSHSGDVYLWGQMFGDTPKKQDIPETITCVSAGDSYTIALGQSGIVYFYGGIKERIVLSGQFLDIRGVLDIYFNQTVTMVQAQPEHFLVLTEKKQLYGYGRNDEGQVGDGTRVYADRLKMGYQQRISTAKITSMCGGFIYSMYLNEKNEVSVFGGNEKGELGDGSRTTRVSPITLRFENILNDATVATISCGRSHAAVLLSDGRVVQWGSDSNGQLGVGRPLIKSTPFAVTVPPGVDAYPVKVTANGQTTMTTMSNGLILACGDNYSGQLGDGGTAPRSSLYPVDTSRAQGENITVVKTGLSHSIAVQNGIIITWGANSAWGQLGDGSGLARGTPDSVYLNGDLYGVTIRDVAAGYYHNLALSTTGEVFAWGGNGNGQVGDYSTSTRVLPVSLLRSTFSPSARLRTPIAKISAGPYTSFAISTNGTLFGWGNNMKGQLGLPIYDASSKYNATVFYGFPNIIPVPEPVMYVAAGSSFTIAIATSGNLYSWGEGVSGQLGAGEDETVRLSPRRFNSNMIRGIPSKIDAGSEHVVLLTDTGNIYTWGSNSYGQLGDGTQLDRWEPTLVAVPIGFQKAKDIAAGVSHTAVVMEVCEPGYGGVNCGFAACFGESDTKGCNGQGRCLTPNVCTCNRYRAGTRCELYSTEAIVLIVSGCLVGTAIVITLVVLLVGIPFCRKQVKRKRVEMELRSLLRQSLLPGDVQSIPTEEWFIKYEDLQFHEKISEGAFGVVFRGVYRNSNVAIKKIKDDFNNRNEFENEVRIMKSLRHPNVLLFMGACIMGDFRLIVTELMGNSLESAIHSNKSQIALHGNLSFKKKVDLIMDIVRGMIYLHGLTPPVLHRDLKPSNILLDANMTTAKVCDFGASKFLSKNTMTANTGTLLYMAPEALQQKKGESYTEKGDVYSFAIIMYEVFFEKIPFTGEEDESLTYTNMFNVGLRVIDGSRPEVPMMNYSPQEEAYLKIMKQCWDREPDNRPPFTEIFDDLTFMTLMK